MTLRPGTRAYPPSHHGVAHAAGITAGYLSTNNISGAWSPSDGSRELHAAVPEDAQSIDLYAWASNLSIMERFIRDDQRHERLAVSLGLCHSTPSVSSHFSKDTRAETKMPAKGKDNQPTDLYWEDSSYSESSYDPYDQPPPAIGLPSPSALPAPNVSFEKYQELMREYFASEDPNPPTTEKTAKPPPLKPEKAALSTETVPTPPPRRDSMSIQALLNDPGPQDHISPGYPPEPRHVPPCKIVSVSPLQLEPDSCQECKDDDGSIRAFAEEAHKRLVPPVSSVAPVEPAQAIPVRSDEGSATTPDEQMLSQHRSRIEESRGHPRSRTARRALLRKRKREGDHPPGRAHPAIRQWEE
ncbi:hypothetical protein DL546_000768 [Coniochaeta pulveracea]|uniref:Uncharacterized protein n=1 Tax=Coniochaeta pulveracea TaxID=177199 RepID=A0A420YKN9_9PEZI|nr:hypothetical protein DL546_000768 [Coniochaeta pulveracea]